MNKQTFLVEIGTEELPPKSLRFLAESFANNLISELNSIYLSYRTIHWFATPRRLALLVYDLSVMQSERIVQYRGPAIKIAFDCHGLPTQAALSWARTYGITIDQAERLVNNKGEWLMYNAKIPGKKAEQLLPEVISLCLKKLPTLKQMRWGISNFQFIRPVHTIILMLGNTLIPANIFGIDSSAKIYGHRFIGEQTLIIDHADNYLKILLENGKVEANYFKRKKIIQKDAKSAAEKINGIVKIDNILLEEVASLVEWPIVLIAKFEEKFLMIPSDALVHSIVTHQKYFPVYSKTDKLLPYFIFVSNITSSDPQLIISGHEKVIRARLEDAMFFFKNDCKNPLENNLPLLEKVIFQKKLGNLLEKTYRIQDLAEWIATHIHSDACHARRAGLLSKCDLISQMVIEFTEIQGVMGMHYARLGGESEEVAVALMEQYKPRFSGDSLPSHPVSYALSIADKMDTLVGIFGINQHPTGDKDPFALRRLALGVLRIIIEKKLSLDLYTLSVKAIDLYNNKILNSNTTCDIIKFMLGRLYTWYKEKGYRVDTIQSVLACHLTKPIDIDVRIQAITYFRSTEQSVIRLSLVHKRIVNILSQTNEKLNNTVYKNLLKEPEEIQLNNRITAINVNLNSFLLKEQYKDILMDLILLNKEINNFFNKVLVNSPEKKLRMNRLTLLSRLNHLFLTIADLTLLKE
ncbi:glycine--tRNA ligase subunit beta [Candidatus Erwinia haradaeae]|uniref:Glycine--tRNA ligase beta subunit n=1 Tax=Candidatus Erwinia haradaeae TaxID=1922217 RepID=A0A451D1T7_9GAMM|nr:glycine--tRNA ligase subunit beta [Candidatus Erwinia haradaeae]VFP79591.1 Glycine--tRNA ligase beta subunit [Candidatus Erwinia haradaeae]